MSAPLTTARIYSDHDRQQLAKWLETYCDRDGVERVLSGKILDYLNAVVEKIASLEQSATAAGERERRMVEQLRLVPTHVVLDVSEIPNRDSPDDQPEIMLVTGAELSRFVSHWINYSIEKANG